MNINWPSRQEWAAAAEHSVKTACFPLERVPDGAEHYLTPDELAEMRSLHVELSKAARPVLSGEIARLQAVLPTPAPQKVADYCAWLDTLTPEQANTAALLALLKHVRRDVGQVANGRRDPLVRREPLAFTVLARPVVGLLSGLDGWQRLAELDAAWQAARLRAADEALAQAIEDEVAKRNSDEGWAKELERRARIDGGPLITSGSPSPVTTSTPTKETTSHE